MSVYSFSRPWYVEAATPTPKDVLIVLDISRSMSNWYKPYADTTLLKMEQTAAIIVVETLNPNDRVSWEPTN
jgi:hypothetical protein